MKTINVYCNYGVLGAEKRNVYTYGEPHFRGTCSDEMTVIVPDGWELYTTISGSVGVTAPWGWDYLINDILSDLNGHPVFKALDKNGRPTTAFLYTAEELEKRKEFRKRKMKKMVNVYGRDGSKKIYLNIENGVGYISDRTYKSLVKAFYKLQFDIDEMNKIGVKSIEAINNGVIWEV